MKIDGLLSLLFDNWSFPKMGGTPKASVFVGFSLANHTFWVPPVSQETHILGLYDIICKHIDHD